MFLFYNKMMLIVGVFCIFLGYCASQLPHSTKSCSIFDSECQRQFFIGVKTLYAATGFPSIGVPIIDPLQLATEQVDVLGLWNLTFYDGVTEGIGNCDLPGVKSDMESRTKTIQILCDKLVVRGRYKLVPSPAVQQDYYYSGDGNLTLTFEKWYFEITYPFVIVKHEDNNIYVEGEFAKANNVTKVDKITVEVDGTKLEDKDNDEQSNSWLNKSWKMILGSNVGKRVIKKCFDYYGDAYDKFFKNLPADLYYSDNLTSYVSNFYSYD